MANPAKKKTSPTFGIGEVKTQLNTIADILQELDLLQERFEPTYPAKPATQFRDLTYAEVWQKCINERFYDFLLIDYTFLQFRIESYQPLLLSFAFYECPFVKWLSYDQFIQEQSPLHPDYTDIEFGEQYEWYRSTLPAKVGITPIRYDYRPEHYKPGRHPASHFHFGHQNNIRLGTKRVLNPLSFALLVLRQCYPDQWTELHALTDSHIWCRNIRDNLIRIDDSFWNSLDDREMFLE